MYLYRSFTKHEEIDHEYDLESALNMAPCIEWFINGSAKARTELNCKLDVRFGPTLDETVDVYPSKTPGSPVLVFIHGGWWRFGTSKEFSLVAPGPVGHDVTVVVTNYSLCPKVSVAEITRQSRAAMAWERRLFQRLQDHERAIPLLILPMRCSRTHSIRDGGVYASNTHIHRGSQPTIVSITCYKLAFSSRLLML